MRLFLGVGVVLFAVIPTLLTLRMNFTRRIASVLIGCAAAALLAYVAGADMPKAFLKAADLVVILGYTSVAAVASQNDTVARLGRRVGTHPVAVMFLAAGVAVMASNDTAVVALAPIAVFSRTPWRTGAARSAVDADGCLHCCRAEWTQRGRVGLGHGPLWLGFS